MTDEARRASSRQRTARYREKLRRENPERLKEMVRRNNQTQYYKNPEARRAAAKAYYYEHFEETKARRSARQKAAAARGYHTEHRKRYPVQHLIRAAKNRAKKWSISFDLTREWLEARYNGRCELTGIEFVFRKGQPNAFSPSLDRIDNSRGYVRDNCRFVLWAVNRFKNNDSEEDMMRIARALVARAGS